MENVTVSRFRCLKYPAATAGMKGVWERGEEDCVEFIDLWSRDGRWREAGLTFWPAKINFDQTGGINWF